MIHFYVYIASLNNNSGYCVKRYIAYLMRMRKQSEVEANNKFYYQLLYEALPPDSVSPGSIFLRLGFLILGQLHNISFS